MRTHLLLVASVVVLAALGPGDARAQGRLAVMIDAGVPDGAGGALVVQPFSLVRLHAGVSYNGVAPGARAGVTVAAWRSRIAPTLTVEAGRFLEGDARPLARILSGDDRMDSPLLEEVGYDFASGLVGFELAAGPATVFLQAGATIIHAEVRGLEAALAPSGDSGVTLRVEDDPTMTMYAPAARLGFLLHF